MELEFLTTDELFEELGKRFPFLIVAYLTTPDTEDADSDYYVRWSGGITQAIGLARRSVDELVAEALKDDDEE